MTKLKIIKKFLQDNKSDAYIIYDFRGSNYIGRKALEIDPHTTRRWVAIVGGDGSVSFIIPKIEISQFTNLSGEQLPYSSYTEFNDLMKTKVQSLKRIHLETSNNNDLAITDIVPAGFIELLRSFNPDLEIISSANLTASLSATWGDNGLKIHLDASSDIAELKDIAYEFIVSSLRKRAKITDYDVRKLIISEFRKRNLITEDDICIVSTNERTGDAHYFPSEKNNFVIEPNSILLLDIWAKKDVAGSVFSDSTFMAWIGPDPLPVRIRKVWDIVKDARDIGIDTVVKHCEKGLMGYEVDRKVRDYIISEGYGDFFIHRTGHSIDQSDHGNGADLDDYEKKDTRVLYPDTGFSIEPGIYLSDFGVRSEINMYIDRNKKARVTTHIQEDIEII